MSIVIFFEHKFGCCWNGISVKVFVHFGTYEMSVRYLKLSLVADLNCAFARFDEEDDELIVSELACRWSGELLDKN